MGLKLQQCNQDCQAAEKGKAVSKGGRASAEHLKSFMIMVDRLTERQTRGNPAAQSHGSKISKSID
ncbi:MAG: hypothetical protein Kow002_11980 [Anaerolineales bacterium]